jgi:hypothetical protein
MVTRSWVPPRRFLTAEEYGNRPAGPGQPAVRLLHPQPAEWCARVHWTRTDYQRFVPPAAAVDLDHAAPAVVNRGRWIVRCPFCPGAQLTHRSDPRFFCVDCLNETNGHQWVRVLWPTQSAAIEAALAARPTATCNWEPHETAAQLVAENKLMGWM